MRGDIPPRFVTVVGTGVDGDSGKERPILDGMSAVRTPFPAAGFGAVRCRSSRRRRFAS